jgi:hypothetical protein
MVTPGALQRPEPFVTLYQLSLIRQPPASFISKGLLWAAVQKPSERNKRFLAPMPPFYPRGSGKYLMEAHKHRAHIGLGEPLGSGRKL